MWGLLQRNIFRRPLFYRTMTAPFVNRRLAHGEKEPYTEGPNGFLFNEKVCFRHSLCITYPECTNTCCISASGMKHLQNTIPCKENVSPTDYADNISILSDPGFVCKVARYELICLNKHMSSSLSSI